MKEIRLIEWLEEYRNVVQFVDITFTGARLDQFVITIPRELWNNTSIKGVEEKVRTSYPLFDDTFSLLTKPMKKHVDKLRADYTRSVPHYGRVILVEDKKRFEEEYQKVKELIETYSKELEDKVKEHILKTKTELMNHFVPIVKNKPPQELQSLLSLDDQVVHYVEWMLSKSLPTSTEIIERLELCRVYKDISRETILDSAFHHHIEKVYKDRKSHWPHHGYKQEELVFI
ncbi:hypothetical protein [Priestia koreensis]|uniref:Uncharacterized protein n=1 Tax=Priestia koreensis TaxID=284581 RepID=A0A0M0L5H8_9BACI|nr:hypothetical protein [Priestia koreensis]KOO46294.1 hypothetical protein AMD01_10620 [Priestia koreensis]MCM3004376.1 hypothetical protein [Priestia koreensis]